VFISPSAFFFVTRALRIGVYSGGTPCQGSKMNGFAALDGSVPPKRLSLRHGNAKKTQNESE